MELYIPIRGTATTLYMLDGVKSQTKDKIIGIGYFLKYANSSVFDRKLYFWGIGNGVFLI